MTVAEQALAKARQTHRVVVRQIFEQQGVTFKAQAEQAYQEVIRPWWREFTRSQQGAQIGLLMQEDYSDKRRLLQPRISENVRYMREDGREWEAYFFLMGRPRELELYVRQLPEGREPRSWAGAMAIHQHRVQFTFDESRLPDLNLHPVVLIDFAEQITANIVAAHIQQRLNMHKD